MPPEVPYRHAREGYSQLEEETTASEEGEAAPATSVLALASQTRRGTSRTVSLQSQSHPPKKNVIATLEAKCDTLEKRLQASEKEKASLEEVLMLMKEHEKKKHSKKK